MTERGSLQRADVEDFLFYEAALLDEWRIDEWLALFAPGATYEVPAAGASDDANADRDLFYIADDYDRLCHRVTRLKKDAAHSEFPRSICSRHVGNVRVLETSGDRTVVSTRFITYRTKNDLTDTFFGHQRYELVSINGALRIASKRSTLDVSALRPQGRVSILL